MQGGVSGADEGRVQHDAPQPELQDSADRNHRQRENRGQVSDGIQECERGEHPGGVQSPFGKWQEVRGKI